MASETELILKWLYREVFPSGILSFDDLHIIAATRALGKSSIDAEAYVQNNLMRHWNALIQRLDYDRNLGRKPIFSVRDLFTRRLTWYPKNLVMFPRNKDRRLGVSLSSRPLMLRMIDSLSDREYEALACVIINFAGGSRIKLTPPKKEGGIDLFAIVNFPSKSHIFGGTYKPLRIIGQVKKYNKSVQVSEVKELITTIDQVKNQNPCVEYLVPPWFRTASGPIVGWLIAHSGVQSGGITQAKNHGIIISESLDLAEVGSLSRHLDETLAPEHRVDLLKKKVKDLLETNS